MSTGRSLLPVFGFWVVWAYVLSLLVLLSFDRKPVAPLRPEVSFVDAGRVYECQLEGGANVLRDVEAALSESFDHPIEVPVAVVPVATLPDGVEAARAGVDYAADRDAVIVFPANSRRGVLRERDTLLDVTVMPDTRAAARRRFRLRLDGTEDVVVAADPRGFRTIDIPVAPDAAGRGIPADFTTRVAVVDESDLAGHSIVIRADRPPDSDAELRFTLYRRGSAGDVPAVGFSGTFPAGRETFSFHLGDVLSDDDLRRIGAAYDPRPGIDDWYELHLDARPPLMSATDPCFTTILDIDEDAPAALSFRLEDKAGASIQRVLPGDPFWVVAELSEPIEVDCPVKPVVDGVALDPGGVIPAGERQVRLGPYTLPAESAPDIDEIHVAMEAVPDAGRGVCRQCQGRPGGCEKCRGACSTCGGASKDCPRCLGKCAVCGGVPGGCSACRPACESCGGSPNGCARCRGACSACGGGPGACEACRKPLCAKCGGRTGGCAACGFGSGTCAKCGGGSGQCKACAGRGTCKACDGKGGDCAACRGRGTCPTCDGKGGPCGVCGGGGGGGGGGGSPVSPPPTTTFPKGPPKPGDFMIFLINDQRLHEPGDVIADRVREAIADRKPYNQGAIVINDDGRESLLTGSSDPPEAARAFKPFSASRQDLEGQAERVVETIIRKRRNAENPDIRTLVVWPERELVSAKTLEVFKSLASDGRGSVSFLCPDADPERARELAAAMAAEGSGTPVTVRSPKSDELVEHIDDVLDAIGAGAGDRLNVQEKRK